MSWQQIKKLNEERSEALAKMKLILKKSEDEKRDLNEGEDKEFNELNTKAESLKVQVERYERMYQIDKDATEKRQQLPGRDDLNTPEEAADQKKAEQRAAFDKYLRFGKQEMNPDETRALTVTGAGVVGDRPFYDQLVLGMKAYAGV